jgi:hypothetical protein
MIQNDRAHDTGKWIGGSVQPIAQNEGDSSMKNANEHLLQPTYDRLDKLDDLLRKSVKVTSNIKRTIETMHFEMATGLSAEDDVAEMQSAIDSLEDAMEAVNLVAMHYEMALDDGESLRS